VKELELKTIDCTEEKNAAQGTLKKKALPSDGQSPAHKREKEVVTMKVPGVGKGKSH